MMKRKMLRFYVLICMTLLLTISVIAITEIKVSAYPGDKPIMVSSISNGTLSVKISSDYTVLESESVAPMTVIVKDQYNFPVKNALVNIDVENAAGKVFPDTVITNIDGIGKFNFTAKVNRETRFIITANASKEDFTSSEGKFEITVYFYHIPLSQIGAWSLGISVVLALIVANTEVGKYSFFTIVLLPLYTRLRKEEVLDHFVRGQIYGYIMANPGKHYTSIKDSLKVTNGTLSYHLRTLEMQGFIKSKRDGTYKLFYPLHMKIPQRQGIKLSDLQINILDIIRQNSGPTQNYIAKALEVSQQTVSYNLKNMYREGIIRKEQIGRLVKYYIQET